MNRLIRPGAKVGDYVIVGVLGRGGMGVVYEASGRAPGERVALKVLAPEYSGDARFRARFRREGAVQAALDHPHVVPVLETGELEGHGLFIAMALVPGDTLKTLVRAGALDARRSLRILARVADALDAAHAAGLVHRDVKPHNVLVTPDDHPYLADFGLVRRHGDDAATRTGEFVGTLDYLSPEHVRGEPSLAAGDRYALAAVAFECLTGVAPFARPNEASTLFALSFEAPPRASARVPGLPVAIDGVLARGLAKAPEERPATAAALLRELQAALEDANPPAPSPAADREARMSATAPAIEPDPVEPARPPFSDSAVAELREALAPPARRDQRPRGRRLAAAALVLVVAGALGALASPGAAPPRAETVSTGLAELQGPAGWRRVPVPELRRLPLADAAALSPTGSPDVALVAGRLEATGASLLPAALAGDGVRAGRVRLGALEALRYPLLPSGSSVMVAQTGRGVLAVACRGAAAAREACERSAASLELAAGVRALPLGLGADYERGVRVLVTRLAEARDAAFGRWRRASSRRRQAAAAGDGAVAYARAGEALVRLRPAPRARAAHDRLARALSGAQADYAALARAARTGDRDAYRRHREAARRAETAAGAALDALRAL